MRPRATLLVKLLVALVVPVVALFTLFAFVAYEVSRRDLDGELGRRLEAIAASAATQIRDARYLSELSPGDEQEPLYEQAVARLTALAQATDARLFLVDAQHASRGDTREPVTIGTPNRRAELDRTELARVFQGTQAASVTFQGNDGRWYKTGYAPAFAADKSVMLAVGAEAPASYFERLADLRMRLFRWGAGLAIVSVLAAIVATLLITRNVRRLAREAERIGAGDLRVPIKATTRDELGTLAETMERMRVQLAERDAKMQQMLAGIAHEVRNPLAGMTLFAGILRDEIAEGDERRGHVLKIERELGYLERVVNDFLEYARRPKPELADVPLPDLLAEVAQLASTPEITVSVAPGAPARARADGGQLRRALLNLARNAVQAATAAGHTGTDAVRLSAHENSNLVLAVWNRGKEIPAETSGKLFEPFYTTREKGTGLGLAFARDIAADHGGKIEVASAGGETTFSIVLPV
ncbi:MAG TPA: HAMP domain-containing sensor histidine kinase [Kofleriaceae bacterium]|nr:HAMP domain-containing sensor histidine kinase [Kofleriaceae bacterium]